ncbi:MAG: tetratricopeptide repeat protein [Elusimicrobia bacterium]|nr:tetratricopeptide repeat protein [Elusimicrobiota bacterium]
MNSLLKDKQHLMICILLAIATLAAFWRVQNCDFFIFDDPEYVALNNHVNNGITLEGLRWSFAASHSSNWHPATWISHMLDVQLFGMNPRGHHLTNLLFHIANALLLFVVLHRMTGARWESAFVAALFALHPLHVESVAWVSERKDVLSTFFWILATGAYCSYVEHQRLRGYLIVVLFFGLGLMAKPMVVTLPFVLLLLDYWPLQRLQQTASQQKIRTAAHGNTQEGTSRKKITNYASRKEAKAEMPAGSRFRWEFIHPLLREKIPLVVLAALSCIVTYGVQKKGGAVHPWPESVRVSNAFVSYAAYLGKTLWPTDLACFYPLPQSLPAWQVVGAALFLIATTITVIGKARRLPYLAVGWLWYVGTLVPVIGLVQVGTQARADRYTYVPLIGLFIMAAWGISELSRNWRYRKEALCASSTVLLVCLCILTRTQVRYWQDSITTFDHALNVTDDNYIICNARGTAYSNLGDFSQAIRDYDKAIEIKPAFAEAYLHRGSIYRRLGNYRQAEEDLRTAAKLGNRTAQERLKYQTIVWGSGKFGPRPKAAK